MAMQQRTTHVRPAAAKLAGAVTPPGAKSGTVRALVAGALADGTSVVRGGGSGDNVRAMVAACRQLGAVVETADPAAWLVTGVGGRLPDTAELSAGNSGIVLRVLGALGAATRRCVVSTPFPESLGRRGNAELLDSLRQLGADCSATGDDARPPLVVGRGAGLHGGTVTVSSRRSSQFLTGLLLLAPLVGADLEFVVPDAMSAAPMVRLTIDTLARAGVVVDASPDHLRYRVAGGQAYGAAEHHVASDASSVAGIVASIAAVPGSEATVAGLAGDDPGTAAMVGALQRMGVSIERRAEGLAVRGAESLRPIDFDGSACPDSILPMAALACFAAGTSTFSNIETMRYKECDRISDFRAELLAAGADVDERRDALIVHGRENVRGGTTVSGRHDHSVVMALAAVALRSERGLAISGSRSVGQTYRGFFDDLRSLGAEVAHEE